MKYTLYGDTGLTGSVGFTDFMRMTQHYNQLHVASWDEGDFNYDGHVNANDFTLLARMYGMTLDSTIVGAPSVPEPSSVMLALAGLAMLHRRRKTGTDLATPETSDFQSFWA